MANILPNGKTQFIDNNGKPLSGGKVYFYIPNTSTFKNTYQDAALTILNTNPVSLDARGEAVIWGNGSYRQVVYDRYGNLIWDQITNTALDNTDVTGIADAQVNVFKMLLAGTTGASQIGLPKGTLGDAVYWITPEMYGAKGDGTTDDTAAFNLALSALNTNRGGVLVLGSKTYVANISVPTGVVVLGVSFGSVYGYLANNVIRRSTILAKVTGAVVTLASRSSLMGVDLQGLGSGIPLVGLRIASGVQGANIVGCNINNMADEGILCQGIACSIYKILAFNCLLNRGRASRTGVVRVEGSDNFLSEVEANTSISAIVSSDLYLAALYIGGANNFVTNCVGELSEVGVYVTGSQANHRVTAVRADLNYGHGFVGDHGQFVNCSAINNSQGSADTYSGFVVGAGGSGGLYTNCVSITYSGKLTQAYGFDASQADFSTIGPRPAFVNCKGNGTLGIVNPPPTNPISFSVPDAVLRGTGATPSIAGCSFYEPRDGGTISITNFLNGAASQDLYILGKSNVTLVNGSGIFNVGGVDRALAANVIYHYKLFKGSWYQVA